MMTNKEALKAMRTFNHLLEGGDIGPDVTCGDVVKATRVAIEALDSKSEAEEYRVAKRVEEHKTHCNGKDFTYKITCPSCEKSLCGECFDKKAPYCMWCGQALDWSEVEKDKMRTTTAEERASVDGYVESISSSTGNNFFDESESAKMTDETAIKVLQERRRATSSQNEIIAISKAIDALGKKSAAEQRQIPKKVGTHTYEEDDFTWTENLCPHCRERLLVKNQFCQYCGQALDWTGVRE